MNGGGERKSDMQRRVTIGPTLLVGTIGYVVRYSIALTDRPPVRGNLLSCYPS